jgi:hypothetical protein
MIDNGKVGDPKIAHPMERTRSGVGCFYGRNIIRDEVSRKKKVVMAFGFHGSFSRK